MKRIWKFIPYKGHPKAGVLVNPKGKSTPAMAFTVEEARALSALKAKQC